MLVSAELFDDEIAAGPKPEDGRDDPAEYPRGDDEPEELYARYSRALWDEQEAALEPLHNTWIQNILFLSGRQWWDLNPIKGVWGPKKRAPWKEQPVTNFCLPFFKHFLAKVTKNRPSWQAIAGSVEPDDLYAARSSEEVLEAKWMELRMARVFRRVVAWVITTGNGFVLPYWNERTGRLVPLTVDETVPVTDELGEPVPDPETMEPMTETVQCPCGPDGEPIMKDRGDGTMVPDLDAEPHYVDEGEVGAKVLSPFQVRVDPNAECDEDVTFTLVAEPLPVREIKRRWPERAERVQAEEIGVIERYDRLMAGALAGPDTQMVSGGTDRDEEIPKALVLHYHEKPSEQFPKGRYWCTVGQTLLEDPQPLLDGIWPVVTHLVDVEVPGRYHAMATLEAIVGLNREYNEVNAQIKQHHNLLLRGKWLVPIGSNIKRGTITDEPGEVIQHTPGLPPVQADLKPLPAAVYAERERLLAEIERVSGMNRISMGQAPPGVTSGRGFLILQEMDDSDLGPFLAMIEESVAELAWSFLQIIQQRYTDERLVYVIGEDRRYMAKAFKGSDLSGVVDVRPVAESSHPRSKYAQQSALIELMQTLPAFFEDKEAGGLDRTRIARALPGIGLEAFYDDADEDIAEAHREEEDYGEWDGNPETPLPTVQPWQNHEIHDRQHTRVLKSASFERWLPEARQAFLQHWFETRMARDEARMQSAMKAHALQNGPVPPDEGGEA